jgi:CheY-like chemotaxis protein
MAPTILIVDDDQQSLFILAMYLQRYGFKTLEAKDGWEGFELAEAHLPDLIISDYTMPKAYGYFLLQNIRTNAGTAHIPFIMIFAVSQPLEELHKNQRWVEDAFVYSPYMPDELIKTVNRLLDQKPIN